MNDISDMFEVREPSDLSKAVMDKGECALSAWDWAGVLVVLAIITYAVGR